MIPRLYRFCIVACCNKSSSYLEHKYSSDILMINPIVSKLVPPDSDKIFYQCRIINRTIECNRLYHYIKYKPLIDSKLIAINPLIPEIFHSGIIYFEMIPNRIIIK